MNSPAGPCGCVCVCVCRERERKGKREREREDECAARPACCTITWVWEAWRQGGIEEVKFKSTSKIRRHPQDYSACGGVDTHKHSLARVEEVMSKPSDIYSWQIATCARITLWNQNICMHRVSKKNDGRQRKTVAYVTQIYIQVRYCWGKKVL